MFIFVFGIGRLGIGRYVRFKGLNFVVLNCFDFIVLELFGYCVVKSLV